MKRRRTEAGAAPPPAASVGERILTTASELFYKEGVRAVGIQRVIDEAGIAKASLYAHYASKDDLVAACLSRQAAVWRAAVEDGLNDPSLDARGKLLRLFEMQNARIANPEFRGCAFQNTDSEIADAAHPAKAVTLEHRQWLHALVTSLVRETGIGEVAALAGALIVLLDGASASAHVDANPEAGQYARWAVEQLLDMSLPKQPNS